MGNKKRKYVISVCLLVFFLALRPAVSIAFSGCETDCNKCHSLSNKEVKLILEKMKARDARILSIGMSPVKGLWEVDIENRGQRGLFYVDFSKKYLISGSVVEVNAAINKTKERLEELNKDRRIKPASIPLKDALVLGNKTASKKVIVFTDPE
jgi:thiol:disulfide interchange protein DsbC